MRTPLAFAAVCTILATPSLADEQMLKFQFITHVPDEMDLSADVAGGQSLSTELATGVAVFEDGRIAEKIFVDSGTSTSETEGMFSGFSAYIFANGDSLNASFTGGWSEDGVGGDYTILSGTGAYEGATGSGRFDRVDSELAQGTLWTGEFRVTTPDS